MGSTTLFPFLHSLGRKLPRTSKEEEFTSKRIYPHGSLNFTSMEVKFVGKISMDVKPSFTEVFYFHGILNYTSVEVFLLCVIGSGFTNKFLFHASTYK